MKNKKKQMKNVECYWISCELANKIYNVNIEKKVKLSISKSFYKFRMKKQNGK